MAALAALAALTASAGVMPARAADANPPGAGTLLQQVAPPPPAAGATTAPRVRIEGAVDAGLQAGTPFEVRALQISGNTLFDEATLQALVADARGQRLNLAQLDRLIGRITALYRSAGHPLARAIIPAQTIEAGVVRIEVIEARLGSVQLDNRSRVDNGLLQRMLAPLRPGELLAQATLDRALLLIDDLPGAGVSAVLRPGSTVGSSDLAVRVEAGAAWAAQAQADNHGNRYTGPARLSAGASLFNPLGYGDLAQVSLLSSGKGLQSGRLGYEVPLGGAGTRLGTTLSALHYELGDSAASLLAHGMAASRLLTLVHPLRRATDWNLRAELQAESLDLRDRVDATSIRNDRRVNLLSLRLSGDMADNGSRLQLLWSAAVVGGRVRFDDALAAASDAAAARTAGSFSKAEGQLLVLHPVTAGATVALSLRGQRAEGNLDASQKLSLGGPAAVRAYEAGTLSGDSAWLLAAEWRQTLPLGTPGTWQAVAFVDSGHATINQRPWQAGSNSATLHGAGLGLQWAGPDAWQARLNLAAPVGATPDVQGLRRGARAWVELRKAI